MTVEHFYQAMKTTNSLEREIIRMTSSPHRARRAGQKIALRPDWEEIKVEVMRWALKKKFTQNPRLRDALVKTGNAELIEDAPWDKFWGDGGNGDGQNMLGKLLMELREELRAA